MDVFTLRPQTSEDINHSSQTVEFVEGFACLAEGLGFHFKAPEEQLGQHEDESRALCKEVRKEDAPRKRG